ncbi:ribonuclease H-like domain-containing protein [Naematelia encephala]|uniref:Ribonuclease H-like domain-containing protein n=1 Tax=Naematelia encephala TaxID=71784 RepID=A0A1Y2AVK3_9TREE|nr:ribonuclease H-like domain-containing protein [Naematelia encephala]
MTDSMLPALEQYVAIDCEMVQVKSASGLAKVGMVDHQGAVLLESFVYVNPRNVKDWRSDTSGIMPGDLDGAPTFEEIQPKIKAILNGKIIVGHAVFNDLNAIQHRHPYEDVRDTSLFYPLRAVLNVTREGEYPSLKRLCKEVLHKEIQYGQHCPVEDARATMALFMTVRDDYETSLARGQDVVAGVPRAYEKWYW